MKAQEKLDYWLTTYYDFFKESKLFITKSLLLQIVSSELVASQYIWNKSYEALKPKALWIDIIWWD